jgi:hypothetical protein
MWWAKDPDRLKREVAAIDDLREREPWLSAATPRLVKGLKLAFDFDVVVNDETFPFILGYPDFFPETPPVVMPRDGRHLSGHQYGDGGELCLEYRADNWDSSITGAMMIASTHRLLAAERPTGDERPAVPSAHHVSIGQQLRGWHCRFLMTAPFLAYVTSLPVGSYRQGGVIESAAPNKIWVACVAAIGASAQPDWREPTIPERARPHLAATVVRVASLADIPAMLNQEDLDRLLTEAGGVPLTQADPQQFIVVSDAKSARMFLSYSKDDGRAVIQYRTIDLSGDQGDRLPPNHAVLPHKRIGIVGCGSLGSKIAAHLARGGVRDFVLVDDDILKPGNLVRHELDADGLGLHKADALGTRI